MNKLKKLLLLLILGFSFLTLVGCKEEEGKVLRIYNWQDYIDDGTEGGSDVIEDFKAWYKEKYGEELVVVYDTFETNEVMMNSAAVNASSGGSPAAAPASAVTPTRAR